MNKIYYNRAECQPRRIQENPAASTRSPAASWENNSNEPAWATKPRNPATPSPQRKGSKMQYQINQNSKPLTSALAIANRLFRCRITAVAAGLCLAASSLSVTAGSGNVLPPTAKPQGWSIDDMAAAVANFSISGNNLDFYPDTPFQIIFRHPGNSFTVKPGTFLYVKVIFIDDSAPVIGNWPADKSGVADYFFGRTELGAHDLEIEVDGKVFSLDNPGYVGGPVPTPDSPDGSTYFIQTGAFVTPLSPGTHKLTIRGVLDGDAMVAALGGPFATEIHYTITVE